MTDSRIRLDERFSPTMYFQAIVILFHVFGASRAVNGCVREENCTLTEADRGIYEKTCDGYRFGECECVQLRSINFEYTCHCCSNSTRSKRDVALEAMFGLKTYRVPEDSKVEDTAAQVSPESPTHKPIEYKKLRLADGSCGKLGYADPQHMTSEVTVSPSDLKSVTIRSTHATSIKNCWNLCRYDILSANQSCTAVGFIEANSQKIINDCYILSESPTSSTGGDGSVEIYEVCV